MPTALIQTKVDREIKEKADAIYKRIGLTTNDAIKTFLYKTTIVNDYPFDLRLGTKKRSQDEILANWKSKVNIIELGYDKTRNVGIVPADAPESFKDWVRNG